MVSQRCRSEIRRYTELKKNNLLKFSSRKFFAYAVKQLHSQDSSIMYSISDLTRKTADICTILSAEFSTKI